MSSILDINQVLLRLFSHGAEALQHVDVRLVQQITQKLDDLLQIGSEFYEADEQSMPMCTNLFHSRRKL